MPQQNSSISNFKRFLLKILLPLIAIVSVGGGIINYFFEKKIVLKSEISGAYKVNRIINETHPEEIPIFGSSRAAYGIIPDSLGSNYFNYGLAGTQIDVALFFMQEECKKTKKSPWMIVNFDMEGAQCALGDIANYIVNTGNPDVKKLMGKEYKPYLSIPFIKYYGRFETFVRQYLNSNIELTKFTNKGAALEKNVLPQAEFDALVKEREKTETTFSNDSAVKERLLSTISKNANRKFLFVIAPYHPSYYVGYKNPGAAASFLDTLRSYNNVRIMDFGKMNMPDSLFLNTTHINLKGALVFNHALRDSLIAAGIR